MGRSMVMESSFANVAVNESKSRQTCPVDRANRKHNQKIANADCSGPRMVNQSLSAAAELVLRAPDVYLFVV